MTVSVVALALVIITSFTLLPMLWWQSRDARPPKVSGWNRARARVDNMMQARATQPLRLRPSD